MNYSYRTVPIIWKGGQPKVKLPKDERVYVECLYCGEYRPIAGFLNSYTDGAPCATCFNELWFYTVAHWIERSRRKTVDKRLREKARHEYRLLDEAGKRKVHAAAQARYRMRQKAKKLEELARNAENRVLRVEGKIVSG